MTDAEKLAAEQQATAQAKAATDAAAKTAADQAAKDAEARKATGLDSLKPEDLKALYAKSPQMFEGIVPKKEEQKPPPPPQSAAPVFDGKEIQLPTDVPINKEVVAAYLTHAKENGFSVAQVQADINFQAKQYREAQAKNAPPTPQEQDAANVAKLKTEFGASYDANIEIARQAAAKFADPDLLEKLKTSDPVLIRHFLKLGKADADATTPNGGTPRNGNETDEEAKSEEQRQKARFPKSPQMFTT